MGEILPAEGGQAASLRMTPLYRGWGGYECILYFDASCNYTTRIPLSQRQLTFTIRVVLLEAFIYFADKVCTLNAVVHLVFGVFFGFLIGHARPRWAFWTACFIGFSKETIDYFKHSYESSSFNYLTDMKYGILDGFGDWFFWMLGGLLAYKLLERVHALAHQIATQQQAQILQNMIEAQAVSLINTSKPELVPIAIHNAPKPIGNTNKVWQLHR